MVVGDKNVLPPIVVIVKGDHTQPVARLDSYSGALAHVGKRAVAVIVIERWRLAAIHVWVAITSEAGPLVSAPEVALRRPIHIVSDHQVQQAIVVVIKPRCTGAPFPDISDTGAVSHIGEGSIAVVMKQDRPSVT